MFFLLITNDLQLNSMRAEYVPGATTQQHTLYYKRISYSNKLLQIKGKNRLSDSGHRYGGKPVWMGVDRDQEKS